MRRGLITAICGGILGAMMLAPGSAGAAVTCNFAAGTVTINITAPTTRVEVDAQNGTIRAFANDGGGTDECMGQGATNVSTDTININDATGGGTTALISLQRGAFEPGASLETGTAEIEILYDGMGGTDRLEVEGSDVANTFDLGQDGATAPRVNLNAAAEAAAPDCDDIAGTNVEEVVVHGRAGEDDINASGCGPFAALDPALLTLEGNNEKDFVRGGPGADSVLGGTQDDNVNGGAGDDSVSGGDQDDKLDGGTNADNLEGDDGTDRVLYDDRTESVTGTVGNGVADDGTSQDQGGSGRDNIGITVEHLTGGAANDSITGSSARNVLNGGLGDDFILGGAGNDDVEGEGGNDTVDGEDGNDEGRGGDGTDTLRGGKGSDKLYGGASADKLLGGSGGDVLKGDKGKDRFSGQAGADKLNAKDKKKDRKISCGKGKASKESAKVDKVDPRAKSC